MTHPLCLESLLKANQTLDLLIGDLRDATHHGNGADSILAAQHLKAAVELQQAVNHHYTAVTPQEY